VAWTKQVLNSSGPQLPQDVPAFFIPTINVRCNVF
jgi:hypothetical protein